MPKRKNISYVLYKEDYAQSPQVLFCAMIYYDSAFGTVDIVDFYHMIYVAVYRVEGIKTRYCFKL